MNLDIKVVLPPFFHAIKRFPGYFWNTEEEKCYSIKVGGTLRPLKKNYGWHGATYHPEGAYRFSKNGTTWNMGIPWIKKNLIDFHVVETYGY